MIQECIFFLLYCASCSAIIPHLSDSEYSHMPPLWALDGHERCLSDHGTYCVLQLSLVPSTNYQLMHSIQEYSALTSKHYNHSIIERGVCVTEACQEYITGTTEDLKGPLETCLNSAVQRDWGLGAKMTKLYYCEQHDDASYFNAWDYTVLAIMLAIATLNCAGSIYDYYVYKQNEKGFDIGNKFLLSFSLKQNWERLTKKPMNPKSKDLQFLHGARLISQFWIILFHVFVSYTTGYVSNPQDIEKTFNHTAYSLIYNGMMFVQIFFFLSGFLTNVVLEQDDDKTASKIYTLWDFPMILMARIGRLLPALAMTMVIVTSWLRHWGSGPLWKIYVTNSLVAECWTKWWHHLIFINNYTNRGNFCLIHTWQLAADMQVSAVAVLVYLASPRLMTAFLMLSVALPAIHTVIQDLDTDLVTPQFLRMWGTPAFWLQHAPGHMNLSCFIIGFITAQKLYYWKKKGGHLITSRWWGLLQYVSVAAIHAIIILSGQLVHADGSRASVTSRALYSSLVRVALGLACALTAFSFINMTNTFLKSLFSWRLWVVPSRLSYCVFLLHMPFVHMMVGARSELCHYSFVNVLLSTFFILLVTYPAAILMHLTVEAPCMALCKAAVKNYSKINISTDTEKHKYK